MLRQRSTLLVLFYKEEEMNDGRRAGSTRLRLDGRAGVGRNVGMCDVSTDDGQTIFSFVRLAHFAIYLPTRGDTTKLGAAVAFSALIHPQYALHYIPLIVLVAGCEL